MEQWKASFPSSTTAMMTPSISSKDKTQKKMDDFLVRAKALKVTPAASVHVSSVLDTKNSSDSEDAARTTLQNLQNKKKSAGVDGGSTTSTLNTMREASKSSEGTSKLTEEAYVESPATVPTGSTDSQVLYKSKRQKDRERKNEHILTQFSYTIPSSITVAMPKQPT